MENGRVKARQFAERSRLLLQDFGRRGSLRYIAGAFLLMFLVTASIDYYTIRNAQEQARSNALAKFCTDRCTMWRGTMTQVPEFKSCFATCYP